MNDQRDPPADGAGFQRAWWLPSRHAQTIWGPVVRPRRAVPLAREVLQTPDGDELIVDWLAAPKDKRPILVALHGLEGSSYSVYVQGVLAAAMRHGWRAVALNFRSCARDPQDLDRMIPNRRPRLYHSGETEDLGFLLRTIHQREPQTPIAALGASLGGNVLLKWLGENPDQREIRTAVALSVPFDLAACALHLETGLRRLYMRPFLRTLRPKALAAAERYPEAAARIDVARVRRAATFYEFDDAATAPLHGFAGADDYYARSSSLQFLRSIGTPTLCVTSLDDPFVPRSSTLEARRSASAAVAFETPRRGGHIGFVSGASPLRPRYWAEESAFGFLEMHLRS